MIIHLDHPVTVRGSYVAAIQLRAPTPDELDRAFASNDPEVAIFELQTGLPPEVFNELDLADVTRIGRANEKLCGCTDAPGTWTAGPAIPKLGFSA